MQTQIDLETHFPDMVPVDRPPSLQTANTIGTAMFGRRDYDDATDTYIKTCCFSVLLIPLIAFGAYRVSDAWGGWHFFGRVPLSAFAKLWNAIFVPLVLTCIGLVSWHYYTTTPSFVARSQLREAHRLLEQGKVCDAASLYSVVLESRTGSVPEARKSLRTIAVEKLNREISKKLASTNRVPGSVIFIPNMFQ